MINNYKSTLNQITDYCVVYCDSSGYIKESNDKAKNEITNKGYFNILDYIIPEYKSIITNMLDGKISTEKHVYVIGCINDNNYYITCTHIKENTGILFSFKNTIEKNDKWWNDKIISLQISLAKSNNVLRCVSKLCKDVLYKNRSNLDSILLDIAKALDLEKCSVCFKNGVSHIVYCTRTDSGDYTCKKFNGFDDMKHCYFKEILTYTKTWKLSKLIKIPCDQCCLFARDGDVEKFKDRTINVIQLTLNDKVIGYFHFLPRLERDLTNIEVESILDLSHVLAYIVNNKEETRITIDYINKKFKDLTDQTK